jgi:hypothetical protein
MLPFTLREIQFRIQTLIDYGCDLSVVGKTGNIPLWRKGLGLDERGLDFLIGRGKECYVGRQRDRAIKKGDRVAVIGRGIAVVAQVGEKKVHAVLWNRSVLTIQRKEIVWNEANMRWKASPMSLACTEIKQGG